MPSINKVIVAGHLGRDPEVRYTTKGLAIANLSLATTRKWRAEGVEKEETTWVDLVSFGKQAEVIGQHFKKGSPAMFEGRLKQETWEDKQTHQKRSKIVVVIEQFHFIGGGERAEKPVETTEKAEKASPIDDDDVPF